MDTQVTDAQGKITFSDISIPDVYSLRVIPNEDTTFKKNEINCDFKWETGFKCDEESFLITGFSIKGSVLSYTDPMPNVNVYLHSGDSAITEKNKNFLQNVQTDSQGVYKFSNVPSGSYQVVAVYSEN